MNQVDDIISQKFAGELLAIEEFNNSVKINLEKLIMIEAFGMITNSYHIKFGIKDALFFHIFDHKLRKKTKIRKKKIIRMS